MKRLDVLLVERGLAASRSQAQALIEAGRVQWLRADQWRVATKASLKLELECELRAELGEAQRYASRGGLKLAGALERTGIDPNGTVALDVGQSTGGFTDCLLQAGAAKVVGVDVGRDQLVPSLRGDPRVVFYERVNARDLPTEQLLAQAPAGFDILVMDVSFISQTLILPGLPPLLKPGGQLLSLVKPQFEVGKTGIGKGGIVRDASLYRKVEMDLREMCGQLGLEVRDYFSSPITGGGGNREFFIWARKDGERNIQEGPDQRFEA